MKYYAGIKKNHSINKVCPQHLVKQKEQFSKVCIVYDTCDV